jgi:hypothetical protein
MDDFYLPDDVIEWLSLKKSEYLSRLIEYSAPGDFEFHQYMEFDELIPNTLSMPDYVHDSEEDGHRLKSFVKTYQEKGVFQQVVVGALLPDQNKQDVFIPILALITRRDEVVRLFVPVTQGTRH